MIKRKLTEADFFLIAANLLPVYGVWFLGWNVKEVFLVYCLETIIIGLFTLLKLAIATIVRKKTGGKMVNPELWCMAVFLCCSF